MQPVLYNAGISMDPTDCDSVIVELRDAPDLSLVRLDTVVLKTDGTITYDISPTSEFPTNVSGGHYYVVLRTRNALETWSAATVLFSASTDYNFTTATTQAYGLNEVDQGDGSFAIWSGDVNQDGFVESSDYSAIENASQQFLFGYFSEDLTGDNLVESADYGLIENNSQLFIITVSP